MNILMITENDPAGMAIAFCKAINRYSGHSCRLITTAEKYNFGYETDIHLPNLSDDETDKIEGLLKNADIIHFHILMDEHNFLGPFYIADYIKGKTVIHHHHGHPDFRTNPGKYRQKYRKLGRRALVSTPDLLKLLPEARWQPNIVPVDNELYCPAAPGNTESQVTVGQSPTRKDLKNTDNLRQCIAELEASGLQNRIKLKIFELMPHKDCLTAKKRCHVIFDHMQGYYGVSSLESLSQGKPVIAGLDKWNREHIRNFSETDELPWCIATTNDELKTTLHDLCLDKTLREETGRKSRSFMENHWHDRKVCHHLLNFYATC